MKCKPLLLGMIAATVLGSGLATIEAVLAQKPVGTVSGGTADSSATTSQSIKRQIAELEVERALQNARFIPASPVIQSIDSRLRSLRQRLVHIQPNGHKTAVATAVSQAIKAKIAELERERAEQATRYIPQSPVIQMMNSQLNNLRQRLVQIQRSAS